MTTRTCAAILLLAGVLAPAPAAAEWRRLDTPNFVVVGDASERDLRNIAIQFEGFRETLGRVLSANVTATAVPTVVFVFPHDRAFTPYKPLYKGKPVDVGGVFYSGRDLNYITLVNDGREGRMQVLFHEYAHLMISNVIMNLPTWLNEGLAEYYSTYDPAREGREAVIGRHIDSHLLRLAEGRLLPLKDLLAVDRNSPLYNEDERRSLFYAQSWALTHMLLLGEPARVKELAAFIKAVQDGVAPAEAWRQAFEGVDIDKALQQYVRQRMFRAYRYTFTDAVGRVDTAARPLSQQDASAFLAGLRIRQQRLDDADALATAALQTDKAHVHANVAKAQVGIARGDLKSAGERLAAMSPASDWFLAYAAGTALADTFGSDTGAGAETLAAARAHLEAAARTREVPNALADLVRLDVGAPQGTTKDTRARIERARKLAPGRDDYALLHARVLANLGEFALARSVLGPMMTGSYPEHVRTTAKNWMANVVRLEQRHQAMTAAAAAPPPARPDERADARPEAARFEPDFRVVQAGEQRMEGTLERISCPAKAPVTFHVRTATGLETLQAAKFESVDFITYRDDVSGSITCGPLKQPMRVYATWKQGSAPDSRAVIAIEFLPK